MACESFYENVHMVGHDGPGDQSIALTIEVKQRIFDKLGYFGLAQPASACSLVEECITVGVADREFHLFERSRGQAVEQPKRDELQSLRRIEMRKIPARMPAFGRHRTAPLQWRSSSFMQRSMSATGVARSDETYFLSAAAGLVV